MKVKTLSTQRPRRHGVHGEDRGQALIEFRRDIPHYIALFQAGRLPVDKLITHRLTLDQINEGFDRLDSGEAVRQVILFE